MSFLFVCCKARFLTRRTALYSSAQNLQCTIYKCYRSTESGITCLILLFIPTATTTTNTHQSAHHKPYNSKVLVRDQPCANT